MLSNLKLIFVHGINNVTTNYSSGLYQNILSAARAKIKDNQDAELEKIIQHETLWADLTTDLTNRYLQLQYPKPLSFWDYFFRGDLLQYLKLNLTKGIDPLGMQVMQYIRDKGDKKTGKMNILKEFDEDIRRIFSKDNEDVGLDSKSGEGKNAIIIAHSLGSVIAYDHIMGFRKENKLSADINIKCFITFGSPIPIFTSAMGHPDNDLVLPRNVEKWVNIISPRDAVARYVKPYFRNIPIEEYTVSTGLLPIQAHLGYLTDKKTASIIAREVLLALEA